MNHGADPSIIFEDKMSAIQVASSTPSIQDILLKRSEFNSKSDDDLIENTPSERVPDLEDIGTISVPDEVELDPYTRYKNPREVLKELGRASFDDPTNLDPSIIKLLQQKFMSAAQEKE